MGQVLLTRAAASCSDLTFILHSRKSKKTRGREEGTWVAQSQPVKAKARRGIPWPCRRTRVRLTRGQREQCPQLQAPQTPALALMVCWERDFTSVGSGKSF